MDECGALSCCRVSDCGLTPSQASPLQLKLAVEDLVAQDELLDLACRRCAIILDRPGTQQAMTDQFSGTSIEVRSSTSMMASA